MLVKATAVTSVWQVNPAQLAFGRTLI